MPPSPRITLGSVRRARLVPVVLFYGSASFVVLQVCDIFVSQLGLPGWVFPGALLLLLVGFPIVLATALAYGVRRAAPEVKEAAAEAGDAGEEGQEAEEGEGVVVRVPRFLGRLTWRRTLSGGAVAFAALFLLVGGYASSRAAGVGPFATLLAAGVLEDQEVLLLAEFEATGTVPEMGRTVTEAVRVDLGQSRSITLLEGERVREALVRMDRRPDEALDKELALELAVREGIKAVVTGEVAAAGSGYLLVARVVAAEDGSTLVAVRETAASDAALIDAMDRLSRGLRERIGEPLRALAARPPLVRTTTSSLEALQLYARALPLTRENPARAVPLLQEAVRLDTAFVAAWFHLGLALERVGAPASTIHQALTRGHAHVGRLAGLERYVFQGAYQWMVEGDREGQLRTWETMLQLYPNEPGARANLAWVVTESGNPERALELLEPLLAVPSPSVSAVVNASSAWVWNHRPDSALAVLERATHLDGHPFVLSSILSAQGNARDYDAMELTARRMLDHDRAPIVRIFALGGLASVAAQRGRDGELAVLVDRLDEAARSLEMLEPGTFPWWLVGWKAGVSALRQGDSAQVRAWLRELPAPEPTDSLSAMDLPFAQLAQAHALAGDVATARHFLDELRRWWPAGYQRFQASDIRRAEALIDLQEGRIDDAEATLIETRFSDCPRCLLPLVARAREADGELQRALELWDLYDEARHPIAPYWDAFWVPEIYEARARLSAQLGDPARAANELRLALAAFRDPDPVHDSRVQSWLRELRRLE